MNWKDNFIRAAKELMGEDGEHIPEAPPRRMKDMVDELSSVIQQDTADLSSFEAAEDIYEEETPATPDEPEPMEAIPLTASLAPPRRKTVIAEGAVVRGDIDTMGGVELYGDMQGALQSEDDILISGKLIGDSSSRNLEMAGGRMHGDVIASATAKIDEKSILLGGVKASDLYVGGKIRGSLDILGAVTLAEHAVVLGNISAQGLSVAPGAAIQGELRIAVKDINSAFQDEAV